jgi:flagellin-like protein
MIRKRGISPLIATIILIAITITAGLLIYNLFFSASSTASSVGEVHIANAQLVVDSSGNYVLGITVRNSGTKPITRLDIYIGTPTTPAPTNPTTTVSLNPILQPGQSYTYRKTGSAQDGYTIGNRYLISIVATFSDGSQQQVSTTVTATSA